MSMSSSRSTVIVWGLLLGAFSLLGVGCAGGGERAPEKPSAPAPSASAIEGETLVLFLQQDGTPEAQAAESAVLPTVREIAEEFGMALRVLDATAGAPEEVKGTPLLHYQNHLGRSVYVGRFSTPDRIRAFLRTARRIPLGETNLRREQVAVETAGRATIAAPFKITDLAGTAPAGFSAEGFLDEALRALAAGMASFSTVPEVSLDRGDRSIYVDVYPYRSAEGWLYLSGAAFSQFHCHDPRWELSGEDLAGRWEDREALFAEAGRRFAAEIASILGEPGGIDQFRPVAASTPVRSWEALDLALPPAPPNAPPAIGTGELPRAWTLVPDPAEAAPVSFRFPAPLDSYSGDAAGATGALTLTEGESFSGEFTVDTSTVTMGESDLDGYMHGSQVLRIAEFPRASFRIGSAVAIGGVEWGKSTPITVEATYGMIGIETAVTAVGTLTPDLDPTGEPRLRIEATFEVPIYEQYGIRGPDGPDEARNRLLFTISANLRPA